MGIYIKGMEMPRNCGECDDMFLLSTIGCDCCVFGLNERPTDCPLKEVPDELAEIADRLVLCKDCKASRVYGKTTQWLACESVMEGQATDPDGYCYLGERKKEEMKAR